MARPAFRGLHSRNLAAPVYGLHVSSADEVKSLSPNHRLVIALHSPDGVVETGRRVGQIYCSQLFLANPPQKCHVIQITQGCDPSHCWVLPDSRKSCP